MSKNDPVILLEGVKSVVAGLYVAAEVLGHLLLRGIVNRHDALGSQSEQLVIDGNSDAAVPPDMTVGITNEATFD